MVIAIVQSTVVYKKVKMRLEISALLLPTIPFSLPTTKFIDPHWHSPLANSPLNLFRGISAKNTTPFAKSPHHHQLLQITESINCIIDQDLDLNRPTMGVLPEKIDGGNNSNEKMTMIFTYGTLKRGFSNHGLMQELIATKDAVYIGACRTSERYPLVCGPYRVPFLLNKPGDGDRVWGEMYAVSRKGLTRMDELEGISRGHYERLPIKIAREEEEATEVSVVEAEAYYGHRSYAEEMWRRNGERGYAIYSEKEARGYVKRKDRPHNLTFLDHIRIFLSSPSQTV